MGANAYVLTMCDCRLAQYLGILNYSERHYQPIGNFKVVCTYGHQETTDGSEKLAEAVGKELYDLREAQITKPCHAPVDDEKLIRVQQITNKLVEAGQLVFLMPEF